MVRNLFVCCLVIAASVNIFGQWEWKNPKPVGSSMFSVHFINQDTGWAAGSIVIRTTDGGENWEVISASEKLLQPKIFFPDAMNGYILQYENVLKSTDGGKNWEQVLDSLAQSYNDIFFIDDKRGWVTSSDGYLFNTSDGGANWEKVLLKEDSYLSGISFKDELNGAAVSNDGSVFITKDGGMNWEEKILPSELRNVKYNVNGKIFITGNPDGSRMYISTDYGENWTYKEIPSVGDYYLEFTSEMTGYAVGARKGIRTTDGGESWSEFDIGVNCRAVSFADGNMGVAVGWGAEILKTTDGGLTWRNLTTGFRGGLTKGEFSSPKKGMIIGGEYVLRTSDGGENWDYKQVVEGDRLTSIAAADDDNWYMTTKTGKILNSTDGGETWNLRTETNQFLNSIDFLNKNIGGAAGYASTIYRTVNGGKDWIKSDNVPPGVLRDIEILDSLHWKALGFYYELGPSRGVLFTSNDGGVNWDFTGWTSEKGDMYFFDRLNGVVTGGSNVGGIQHTIDGGKTWKYSYNQYEMIHAVEFKDRLNGIAAAEDGIIRTSDGGATWEKDTSFVFGGFSDVVYAGNAAVLIGGGGGILKEVANETVPVEMEVNNETGLLSYSLEQNYPNPFNTMTNIIYSVPEESKVEILIYNSIGELVKSVSVIKPAGVHNEKINMTGLPSGMFIYRINAGGFVQQKKMVLLK